MEKGHEKVEGRVVGQGDHPLSCGGSFTRQPQLGVTVDEVISILAPFGGEEVVG